MQFPLDASTSVGGGIVVTGRRWTAGSVESGTWKAVFFIWRTSSTFSTELHVWPQPHAPEFGLRSDTAEPKVGYLPFKCLGCEEVAYIPSP